MAGLTARSVPVRIGILSQIAGNKVESNHNRNCRNGVGCEYELAVKSGVICGRASKLRLQYGFEPIPGLRGAVLELAARERE